VNGRSPNRTVIQYSGNHGCFIKKRDCIAREAPRQTTAFEDEEQEFFFTAAHLFVI
jgi:hypothetical protein